MKNFLEITTGKSGSQGNKKVICFEEKEFGSIEELAEAIAEYRLDDWRSGKIRVSSTKGTITQSQWEKLEKLVKEFAEDSVESVYNDYDAYA